MSDPVFTPHVRGGLAVVLLTIAGLLGYTVHQHYQVKQISAQNDQVISSLKDTRAQMLALAAKIDSLSAAPGGRATRAGESTGGAQATPQARSPVQRK